ncbi:MAG TPA: hypothetical protein VN802_15500 [Stellaceae bacterium]|nr:hypothetical protein [Stellaceae bacterium]
MHGYAYRIAALCALMCAGAPGAIAGPPFRTDDPEPVDYQHWEVYGFSQATHVQGDTAGILLGIEVNYGALPDLQLHVIAPVAFDAPSGAGTRFGYGDTELGVKYRFVEEDEDGWRPQIGVFPQFEAPTGDAHRGLGAGHAREFFPVWLQKSFGSWLTYGGGGYWNNPGAGNKNYWFAGWLLQRQVTDDLALGGELFHQTADTAGGHDSTGFNLGGIYDITENYHLLFSAGRGLQDVPDTNEFSYYVAIQWTF